MKKIAIMAAALSSCAAAPAFAQSTDEAQKQATRLISQAISERVSRTVDLGALQGGPSRADQSQSVWALASFTDIGFDGDNITDLYLGTVGWDRTSGDLVFGVSGSYARIEFNLGGAPGVADGGNSYTVSPYAAYKLNDNMFLSGILNLNHTTFGDFDATSLSTEVAVNAFTRKENTTLRGKLAYRGSVGVDPGSDLASILVGFGEAEFQIAETSAFFINTEANWGIDDGSDDIQVYGAAGFYMRPSERTQWGLGYQRLLAGIEDVDISTFLIQFRTVF